MQTTEITRRYSASRKEMWVWGMGGVAEGTMAQVFGILFNIFQTWFGVSPSLLGSVMALPRFVDAVLDPTLGHYSDNLRTRWGRRKPVLLATSIVGGLVLAGIWWMNPAWPQWLQATYLFLFATTYYCALGNYAMAHNALGYELTDDYHERSRLIAIKAFCVTAITVSVAWSYKAASLPLFGDRLTGIRCIGLIYGLIIVAAVLPILFKAKERFSCPPAAHAGLFKAIQEAMSLRPFRIYLTMRFFSDTGIVIFNQLSFFVNVYYVCSGNQALAYKILGYSLTMTSLLSLVLMPLVPRISKHIGKRKGFIISSSLALLQALLMPLLYNPAHPYLQLLASSVTAPLIGIGVILRDAIIPDICDLGELTTGRRTEGLIAATISFFYKIQVSMCVFVAGMLLAWVGLKTGAATQSPDAIDKLRWAIFTPNIFCAAIALFFATRFSITEQEAKATIEELMVRRAAAQRQKQP